MNPKMLEQRLSGIDMYQSIIQDSPDHNRQPGKQRKKEGAAHNTQPLRGCDPQCALPAQEQIVTQQVEAFIGSCRFAWIHVRRLP